MAADSVVPDPSKLSEFRRTFHTRKLVIASSTALIFASLGALGASIGRTDDGTQRVIAYVFAGTLAVSLLLGGVLWSCPGCGKLLGRAVHCRFCRSCGLALEREPASDWQRPGALDSQHLHRFRARVLLALLAPFGIAILLCVAGYFLGDPSFKYFFYAAIIFAFFGRFVFSTILIRCPHCRNGLGVPPRYTPYLQTYLFCPACGGHIRDRG